MIDELASETYAKREAAQERQREHGHAIQPIVSEAAKTTISAEARRRLNQLLTDWQRDDSRTPDELCAVRAVRVLERIGTPESRLLLEVWSKGAEAAILTIEARKALKAIQDQ